MMTTAQEVFAEAVRVLPPTERLRLATLLLQDLTQSPMTIVDSSETWSEHDRNDLTSFSLRYAATLYPEEDELV
jgi:hypothetical protein